MSFRNWFQAWFLQARDWYGRNAVILHSVPWKPHEDYTVRGCFLPFLKCFCPSHFSFMIDTGRSCLLADVNIFSGTWCPMLLACCVNGMFVCALNSLRFVLFIPRSHDNQDLTRIIRISGESLGTLVYLQKWTGKHYPGGAILQRLLIKKREDVFVCEEKKLPKILPWIQGSLVLISVVAIITTLGA